VSLSEEEADELLRALAHSARRDILRLCWDEARSAGTLTDALGLAAASTSEHLKVLRKTGLVTLEKQGTFRWYRTVPSRLTAVGRWLATLGGSGPASTSTHDQGDF
jgi:DNA-binding transcriptional ArsR family regulator